MRTNRVNQRLLRAAGPGLRPLLGRVRGVDGQLAMVISAALPRSVAPDSRLGIP